MPEAHPAHRDLPSLYRAELSVFRGRWTMSVFSPDLDIAAGPNLDLGAADTHTTACPDDPGRYLIDISGEVPLAPLNEASRLMEEHGFVVEEAALADVRTDRGWTQVASSLWTAPCQPVGP